MEKMKMNQRLTSWFKWITVTVVLFGGMCIMYACSQEMDEESVSRKSRVQVSVSPFHFDLENEGMEGGGRSISETVTRLSFAVFKSDDGTLVEPIVHQTSSDASFGTVSLELYPGSYRMVAVAHNGDGEVDIKSVSSAILPGTTFTDTFSKVQDLTVEAGKDSHFEMTLPRATSAFILKLKDAPPANVKEIKVVVNSSGLDAAVLDLNPETRLVSNSWKQTRIIPVGEINSNVPIYFISMYPVTAVTVKATAYDTEGNEIIGHTINNVSLSPNQKTIATGYFFQTSGTGAFTLEAVWGDDKEIEY